MRMTLAGGSYEGRSTNAASQEMVNLFQERGQDAQQEAILVGIHGSTVFATPPGNIRGMHMFGNKVYVVAGSKLYTVDDRGNYAELTEIGSSSGLVSMADNGKDNGHEVIIADGGRLKVWNDATKTFKISMSPECFKVGYIDGYIVGIERDSGRYFYSELYDGDNFPALNFQTAEGAPDNLVSIFVDRREVWLFGTETLEVVYNQGDVDNLFARFQGGFGQMGCAAANTVVRLDNAIAWLGINEKGDAVPVISRNYNPQYLTAKHPQIAYQISKYDKVSDAFGYSYRFEGHEFYVLTFPTADATWCFDVTEAQWHERAHIIDGTFPHRERYSCHVYAWGKHLVGDFRDGKIYELSSDVYTIDGEIIPTIRTTQGAKDNDEDRVAVRMVQLTGEEGVGGEVSLTYSRDGGHTFSNPRDKSFGETGKYKARAIWRKFSSGRDWVFRFTRWEDAKTIYTGLITKEHGK